LIKVLFPGNNFPNIITLNIKLLDLKNLGPVANVYAYNYVVSSTSGHTQFKIGSFSLKCPINWRNLILVKSK